MSRARFRVGVDRLRHDGGRLPGLGDDLREGRDVIVALDKGRDRAEPLDRASVERPDAVAYGVIVRIEKVRSLVAVAGEMDLLDPVDGNAREKLRGIEIVVVCADEYVVDVEEEPAIAALRESGEKLPLRHRRMR